MQWLFTMYYAWFMCWAGASVVVIELIMFPQIFNVDHSVNTLQEAYFSLERPLVAQKLKLNIRHSVFESSNRSCWNLKVLGCTFKQGA